MRQAVRNYIKEAKSEQKCSMMNFSTIDFIPFINYITKVLSTFDSKPYQYHILKVTEEKSLMAKEINVCVIYNIDTINPQHFTNINTESLLKYISGNVKDNKDFIYFEMKSNQIPVLDRELNVNLTSFLIEKFPYLTDVIYDLIAHKYERAMTQRDISYQELFLNLHNSYEKQIKDRQQFLIEEKNKLTKEEAKKERELNHIINFIQSTELDEGTKKILIYSVDKYRNSKQY